MAEKISALRIGTDPRVNWNIQSKLQKSKHRGMILEPEHETEKPSAVRTLTPEIDQRRSCGRGK